MVRQVLALSGEQFKAALRVAAAGSSHKGLKLAVGRWGALTDAGAHAHFQDKDDSHRESMGLGNRCYLQNVEGRFGLIRSGNTHVKVLVYSIAVSTFEDMYRVAFLTGPP